MIERVRIVSYRCIRDLDIAFEPLTALVGPNGSGKSAVLTMLDPRAGLAPEDRWQRRGMSTERTYWLKDQGAFSLVPGLPFPQPLHDLTTQGLRLDLAAMRRTVNLNPSARLSTDGFDIANVFGTMPRSQQSELAGQLCGLVPLFSDVDVVPVGNGMHRLRYQDRWNPDLWYAPDQVSDGTLLLSAFLTLQFQKPPVNLITIEEPERGLHPYLLEQLVGFLRKLSRGEIGRAPIQVVLATHSPELLEYLEPKEVRFLGRDPLDGSTTVSAIPSDDPDWKKYFAEYRESLREAWLSGGLGGVPGSAPGA